MAGLEEPLLPADGSDSDGEENEEQQVEIEGEDLAPAGAEAQVDLAVLVVELEERVQALSGENARLTTQVTALRQDLERARDETRRRIVKEEREAELKPCNLMCFTLILVMLGVGIALVRIYASYFSEIAPAETQPPSAAPSPSSAAASESSIWSNATYFVIVVVFTVGFGDLSPINDTAKWVTSFLMMILPSVAYLAAVLVERLIDWCAMKLVGLALTSCYLIGDADGNYGWTILGRFRQCPAKLIVCFLFWLLSIGVGMLGLAWTELKHNELASASVGGSILDLFYLSLTTLTTVGLGDYAFTTLNGRIFAIFWISIFQPVYSYCTAYMAETLFYGIKLVVKDYCSNLVHGDNESLPLQRPDA